VLETWFMWLRTRFSFGYPHKISNF